MEKKLIKILLVEDEPSDIFLTKEALKSSTLNLEINVVWDGIEALLFLRRQEKYQNAERPDIILLDLNLPKKNGYEVLQELKSDLELQRIPIIVLTTSKSESDILKAYSLHANSFITKPNDFSEFKDIAKCIEKFWFTHAKIPK